MPNEYSTGHDDDAGAEVVREILADPAYQTVRGEREEWRMQTGWHRKEEIRRDEASLESMRRRNLFKDFLLNGGFKNSKEKTFASRHGWSLSGQNSLTISSMAVAITGVVLSIAWWLLRCPQEQEQKLSAVELDAFDSLHRACFGDINTSNEDEGEDDKTHSDEDMKTGS